MESIASMRDSHYKSMPNLCYGGRGRKYSNKRSRSPPPNQKAMTGKSSPTKFPAGPRDQR